MRRLQFWFEFASTYSYLSVMRITPLAEAAGVALEWRPFLLGPIFKTQGWETSPFNLYPAKGRYMVRDIQRIAQGRGLPFVMPEQFPANGLLAARLAIVGKEGGWIADFTQGVFSAQFAHGADIGRPALLLELLRQHGVDGEAALSRAGEREIKDALRAATDEAISLGIFGAPSFVTPDGELFWGDDRLEQALAWVSK